MEFNRKVLDIDAENLTKQLVAFISNGDMTYMFLGHYIPGFTDRGGFTQSVWFCSH